MRSLKATLVIGTLLGLINHSQALVGGHFTWSELVLLLITYLVPFCVTTYGQVQGKRQRDRHWTGQSKLN
ncbi:nitrate/nitrite transporter NrtS [Ktedonospora formicarum]